MSFPTFSEVHPTSVVAEPLSPTLLTMSRRLTPADPVSVLMVFRFEERRSVMADGAVVARLADGECLGGTDHRVGGAGGARSLDRAVAVHMAVDAPAHVQRRLLIDALHVLDLAVTRLARDARVDVAHVRELHVDRHLV